MSKEIWLGPILGTNRERLLTRCAEFIAKGRADRLLYIAASHPLLDLVTARLLDGKHSVGVWGEFPVYLFRGFIRRVLSTALVSSAQSSETASVDESPLMLGLPPRVPIDREELPLRRSLISQIIKQLTIAGKLKAIRPLANRDGCVNTIATLIGELQRAGKTAEEFQEVIARRELEFQNAKVPSAGPKSQADFDREVALIYSVYAKALERFGLTDEDADQLRALQILGGDIEGKLPWLNEMELLVLDGFFDFTPVQGEILKHLIPAARNVIVNLNGDSRNEDIFRPFASTIEHLQGVADFKIVRSNETAKVSEGLAPLRERLFNAEAEKAQAEMTAHRPQDAGAPAGSPVSAPMLIECGDREVEIRAIAKEIKRLVLIENVKLSETALVVRERAAYADIILRVFADESIPCNLERRVEAQNVPALRACGKLLTLLKDTTREHVTNPKAADLAHLIKTGYFRPSRESLEQLIQEFDLKFADSAEEKKGNLPVDKQRARLAIGRWIPDVLENVIAYVGSELRVNAWINRAQTLIDQLPSPEAAQRLITGDDRQADDPATVAADEAPTEDGAPRERRKRPAPIHPATIAWTILVIEHLQKEISAVPEEETPEALRGSLAHLLEQLQFAKQINRPLHQKDGPEDVPQATLDVRALEALRRAIAAAVRSFKYAGEVVAETRPSERAIPGLPARVALSSFIDEIERCLGSQVLAVGAGNRDGLRVLEATDVRGLSFPVIIIAGMIEGGFPLRTSRDWLYPHEERVRLQKEGVFLEDISTETLLKEEHYFYQAACRATRRLYLTRPLALNDGTETVSSYYIEELKRAIVTAEIHVKQVRGDLDTHDLGEASTTRELSALLVHQAEKRRNYSAARIQRLLDEAETLGYLSGSAMRRIQIEHQRNSQSFGEFDGQITDPALQAMLQRYFGAEHVHSASRLSTYGNCPFRFFSNRVLKIEPRNEAALDLQAIDAGKLLHDILRRFLQQYRRQYLPALDREKLRARLRETAEEVFQEHERKVPPLNQRIWKIDCEIRKLILDQVLLYELRLQEKIRPSSVRPAYFELAFGYAAQVSDPKSSPEFLRLPRPGKADEVVLIQGQIDRVDVDERDQVAVAYDYKLSQGAKLNDIEAGRQVQIPIYLAALEQLFLPSSSQLVGGGYYKLRPRGPRLNQGLFRKMFEDFTDTTHASKFDDIEWQRIRKDVGRRVWDFIDGMRGAQFRVKPSLGKSTCKFCDYSAVCRYDTYRITRKHN